MSHGSNRYAWLRERAALAVALAALCLVSLFVERADAQASEDVTRVRICNFGMGDTLPLLSSGGTVSVQSSVVISGSFALRCNPTTTAVGWGRIGTYDLTTGGGTTWNIANARHRFYFKLPTVLPSSGSEEVCRVNDTAGTAKMFVRIKSDGKFQCYRANGTSQIGSDSALAAAADGSIWGLQVACGTGTSADFELQLAPPTTGLFVSQISGTVGSSGLGTVNCGSLDIGKTVDRNGNTMDIVAGVVSVDDAVFPGIGQMVMMIPAADGNATGWTIGGGAGSKFDVVKDIPTDAVTYITSTLSIGNAYSPAMQTPASVGITGIVAAVQTFYGLRREGAASTGLAKLGLRSGATNTDASSTIGTGASYLGRSLCYATNPTTAAAWGDAGNLSIEPRIIEASATVGTRCSSMYVEVEFQPYTTWAGASTGESAEAGALGASAAVAGSSAGESSSAGAFGARAAIAGASYGESSAQHGGTAAGVVAGVSYGETASAAALGASAAIAGQSSGESSATGAFGASAAISGASYGETATEGAGTAAGVLAGSSAGESAAAGAFGATASFGGQSAGESEADGAMTSAGVVAGVAYGETACSAMFIAAGVFSGTAYGESSVSALFGAEASIAGVAYGETAAAAAFGAIASYGASLYGETDMWGVFVGVGADTWAGSSNGESFSSAMFVAVVSITGQANGESSAAGSFGASAGFGGQANGESSSSSAHVAIASVAGEACGESSMWAEFVADAGIVIWQSAGESSSSAVLGAEAGYTGSAFGESASLWSFEETAEASSALLEVADAVAAEIVATSWSVPVVASRILNLDLKWKALDAPPTVFVVGMSEKPKRVSRGKKIKIMVVHIGVMVRMPDREHATVDPYIALVEEIAEHFDEKRLPLIHEAMVRTAVNRPVYDEPDLVKLKQFTSVIRLTVQDWR